MKAEEGEAMKGKGEMGKRKSRGFRQGLGDTAGGEGECRCVYP